MLRKAPQTNVCFLFFKKGTSYLNLLIFKNIWYLQISSAGIIKSAFITSADTLFFFFFSVEKSFKFGAVWGFSCTCLMFQHSNEIHI